EGSQPIPERLGGGHDPEPLHDQWIVLKLLQVIQAIVAVEETRDQDQGKPRSENRPASRRSAAMCGFFYALVFQLPELRFPVSKTGEAITFLPRSGERRRRAPRLGLRAVLGLPCLFIG